MKHYDIFIIGAGAAGIAAAKAAWKIGCRSIAIADRRAAMGGILLQCAHRGFGHEQDGPEFTERLLEDFPGEITFYRDTTVLSITNDRTAVLSGPSLGLQKIAFKQLILATGCREIPLGALRITGTRPHTRINISGRPCGIFTAGQMQELMNIHRQIPEGPVTILGSGDIGLVMASHLAEAGVKISGIIEQKETCSGMLRNQNRLQAYDIPYVFSTTIREICGYPELEGVVLTGGTYLPCRTLLIAAGLVPEQELLQKFVQNPISKNPSETSYPDWIHLCGNARQVHPIVDSVVTDGARAGRHAYKLSLSKKS